MAVPKRRSATVLSTMVLSAVSTLFAAPAPPAVSSREPVEQSPQPRDAPPPRRDYKNPTEATIGTLPPGIGIATGERAPDAAVRDAEDREVSLASLWKAGPIMLVFYRGGWCPYCNAQIHDLTEAFPEFQRRGIRPVLISVDRVKESAKTSATYSIPFPVLSDPDLAAHRAYRVLHKADAAEVARLKGFGIDLEASSGREHHTFAVPAIHVIDRAGVVLWAHADADYTSRPSNAQILKAIDGLGLTHPR